MGGISGFFSLIALLGFLLFIVGVGSLVLASSQGRPARFPVLLIIGGILVGVIFSVVSQGIILVGPSERAVVFNTVSGGLDPLERTAGTHVILPILQQATVYDVSLREYTMSRRTNEGAQVGDDAVEARTNDGQVVNLDITVIYRINPNEVDRVHIDLQDRFEDDFIRPTVRSIVRDVVSQYSAEGIYGEQREEMGVSLETAVTERLSLAGFELTDLLVRDITFSETFTEAIERKTVAEQDAQRAEILVVQEEQEAERIRVQAQGQRDASIARAEGEAQAQVLRAQAEAEALRLVSEQIAANPALIQYQYIQSLADNVNLALVPSNSPFLFDLQSIVESAGSGVSGFTAPTVPESTTNLSPSTAEVTPTPTPGS